MSEIGNTSNGLESKGFFSKLVNGDFGLAKTYWLYGFVVGIVINVLTRIVPSLGALAVILALAIPYQVMVLLGVWRAAEKYQGRKAWAILAKVAAVLGWLGVLASLGVFIEILGYL
ncbi:hypothetical protein FMN52_00925 [Marinobacter sp. BW6]|uniref:hypothetical protein n=1 Tax=Marinobacter sp. BW6 TaxID=2592624 RepID=UPI0011DEE567|nr:hypothetical protein [Marinobacter sp. BW6]TYC63819.1 hypothetical protein FMN52_00925 [Marinobacter sp. BW6]